MATPTLPLQNIVDVTVQIQPNAVAPPAFNQALIITNESTIPTYGVGGRAVQFAGGTTILAQMLAYGFSATGSAYLNAEAYLEASTTPYYLWIGRQDLTSIGTFGIGATSGTGYAVGDLIYPTQAGLTNAIFKVTAISGSGAVTALQFVQQGTGASIASNLPTTTNGIGTGFELNITGLGETCLQATVACRTVAPQWYLFTATAGADSDNIALSEWAQTASPVCQAFWQTASANALSGASGNIFSTLKTGNYNRYQGVYTTTQSVTTTIATTSGSEIIILSSATGVLIGDTVVAAGVPFGTVLSNLVGTTGTLSANATATASGVSTQFQSAPNNAYMASALMGLAIGLNTGFNNSYFTLTNKNLVGMTTEPISETQYLTITGNNGNVYGNFGGSFNSYATGITGSGQYFDNILGIDMLTADLQYAGANALAQFNAVGQNDAGQAILLHAMNVQGCTPSANRGFLSPGVWQGNTIQFGLPPNATIALQAGTSLPSGFLNVSPSYAQISTPPKRASAPIYCAVIQTNAVQQIIIAVMVQQ
jgi:hypothetical protein